MEKITHLIPLSEFIEQVKQIELPTRDLFESTKLYQLGLIFRYTTFLQQPLELWQFVPVGDNGEVLEEPYNDGQNDMYYGATLDAYNKAKERCLFEGFEVKVDMHGQTRRTIIEKDKCRAYLKLEFYNGTVKEVYEHKTVERLIQFGLPLTAQAIKQILR